MRRSFFPFNSFENFCKFPVKIKRWKRLYHVVIQYKTQTSMIQCINPLTVHICAKGPSWGKIIMLSTVQRFGPWTVSMLFTWCSCYDFTFEWILAIAYIQSTDYFSCKIPRMWTKVVDQNGCIKFELMTINSCQFPTAHGVTSKHNEYFMVNLL